MIERYGKTQDLTHKYAAGSSGKSILRMCFACNKPRAEVGGRTNKRTRMWCCAACVTAKEIKK